MAQLRRQVAIAPLLVDILLHLVRADDLSFGQMRAGGGLFEALEALDSPPSKSAEVSSRERFFVTMMLKLMNTLSNASLPAQTIYEG